jgi:hypothetical protein
MFYIIIILAAIFAMPASAQNIVGTWQATSFSTEFLDTKEVRQLDPPTGYLQYYPNGHMVTFISNELHQPTALIYTDAERVEFYNHIIGAYAGTYSNEGNKVIHHVLTAWLPTWVATDQIRYIEINGNNLSVKTAPFSGPLSGRRVVNTVTFVRVE